MQSETFLIRQHFQDVDDFAQTARGWNLNISQLERGRFKGDLLQFGIDNLQVAYAVFHPDTYQQGEPPQDMRTLCILSDPSINLVWRRKMIPENAVMVFPPGGDSDVVSMGGKLAVFTLSFSNKLLATIRHTVGFFDLNKLLNGKGVIAVKSQTIAELRRFLHRICHELTNDPAKLEIPSLRYELEFELPRKLLAALSCTREKMPKLLIRMRDLAIKRVEDYLEEFPNHPHTVRDICRVANVSERTLQYAFRERFGITPKSFLQALRLNGVHRDLKNADSAPTKITDVAIHWGFWHMSQFAIDYQRFFGELPSQTMNRHK